MAAAAGVVIGLILVFAFLDPLISAAEAVLRTLGFGAALVVAVAAADIFVARRRPELRLSFLRVALGAHLLVLFIFGVAGFLKPDWTIGDVRFAEVSAGGNLGKFFAGSIAGNAGLAGTRVGNQSGHCASVPRLSDASFRGGRTKWHGAVAACCARIWQNNTLYGQIGRASCRERV